VIHRYLTVDRLDFTSVSDLSHPVEKRPSEGKRLQETVQDLEKGAIVRALEQTQWNKSKAASLLGVSGGPFSGACINSVCDRPYWAKSPSNNFAIIYNKINLIIHADGRFRPFSKGSSVALERPVLKNPHQLNRLRPTLRTGTEVALS